MVSAFASNVSRNSSLRRPTKKRSCLPSRLPPLWATMVVAVLTMIGLQSMVVMIMVNGNQSSASTSSGDFASYQLPSDQQKAIQQLLPGPPTCPVTGMYPANSTISAQQIGYEMWTSVWAALNQLGTLSSFPSSQSEYLFVLQRRDCTMLPPPTTSAATTSKWELALNASVKNLPKLFCLPWFVSVDDWWTHHPGYRATIGIPSMGGSPEGNNNKNHIFVGENDTHYCMTVLPPRRSKYIRELYEIQFGATTLKPAVYAQELQIEQGANVPSHCRNVFTKRMWQAGWGADMSHLVDGLLYAKHFNVPFQVSNDVPWHYAALNSRKHGQVASKTIPEMAACPTKDMYCYFLPITNCPPNNSQVFGIPGKTEFAYSTLALNETKKNPQPSLVENTNRWIIDYSTRSQTWLRKAVYDFAKTVPPLSSPCVTVHVRRSDVVLHGKRARRYHAIDEYMALLPNTTVGDRASEGPTTIFLLTDDENAIQEALTKYPQYPKSRYRWVFIPRKRFKGPEGGFENQIPSQDPKIEVIVLLTIFRLVRQCKTLIHSQSNMAEYIGGIMLDEWSTNSPSNRFGGSSGSGPKNRRRKKTSPRPVMLNVDLGKTWHEVYNANYSLI